MAHSVVRYMEISMSQQFLTHIDERERVMAFVAQELPFVFNMVHLARRTQFL